MSLAGLEADPFSWPSSLNVSVIAWSGDKPFGSQEITRFQGRSALQNRSGTTIRALEQPVVLSRGNYTIQLRGESSPSANWHSRLAAYSSRVAMAGVSYDGPVGKVGCAAPVLLWGASAAIRPCPLLEGYRSRIRTWLLASPAHLFRLYRQRSWDWRNWIPFSLRPIQYEYAMEVYGPAT